jgi:predicted nucleic acid-binding protein
MTILPRVIHDTNLVVSYARPHPIPRPLRSDTELFMFWKRGDTTGVVCQALVDEYADVLGRPGVQALPEKRSDVLTLAADASRTEHVPAQPPFPRESKDPKDDHLIALAKASGADYLCSSDVEGLLDLHIVGNTVIIHPGVLYAMLIYDVIINRAVKAGLN